ncbi:hypothetical protein [Candidatus Colwellia aromaticivorans]|uniref:hypothetical protein n=1 Tax=Candidatus Colwellia aromaticivorans TaxID=2267621 RepID=UPI000DF27A22|nr:hypothetical protein [Candidatus Colwellia aromaticivorans]
MHIEQVLILLINSLSLKQNKIVLPWAAVKLWQDSVLEILLENGLLTKISKAKNIQCQACENHCNVDVIPHQYPSTTRYYAACDDPFMHEQMGRMTVPPKQLSQWKISIKKLAVLIADLLGLSCDISYKADQKSIVLGTLKSKAGRKSVVLNVEPLSIIINQSVLPVNELLFFEDNKLALDKDKIDHALNLKQSPSAKTYQANTDKKEQRKANTLAMHQSWQDEAIKLKGKRPNMPKTWISQQIAKLPISQGKSAETIRKNIQI